MPGLSPRRRSCASARSSRGASRLASAGYRLEWAPDGRRLRFTALRPGDSQEAWIWEVSVTDGAPTPLWPGYDGAWTGDGRHYVFHRQGNLFVAPGLDAEDRPLVTVAAGPPTTSTVYALDWEAP